MDSILLKNISCKEGAADILIDNGRIARIRYKDDPHSDAIATPAAGTEIVDCTGRSVFPGLINMHVHAGMALMRGLGEDMVFQDWLSRIWYVEEGIDPEYVHAASRAAMVEMVRTGTTTFNDHYFYPDEGYRAAVEAGLNPSISYVFLDRFDKETAARQKDEFLALYGRTKSWNANARFTVGIHAIYSVSEETIEWAVRFANDHDLNLHIHISETAKEVQDSKERFGLSPVEYFERIGAMSPRLIAAHTLWLSENDIRILGENHVACVHNVNSNTKLSSGYRFLYNELRDAGANICIGTDGCASSNNLDLLEAMKTSAILQKAWRNDPKSMPLNELADVATLNAARALRMHTGRIAEGWNADLLIVNTDNTYFLSEGPFLANLVYSAHSDCIESVIAGGRFVMKDRVIPGEREIISEAREAIRRVHLKTR